MFFLRPLIEGLLTNLGFFFPYKQYLLLYTSATCDPVNMLYYCDISRLPNGIESFSERGDMLPFVKLITNFEASYEAIANDDTEFTFLTNKNSPKYKLVRVDFKNPHIWTDVLQESETDVLDSVHAVNGDQILVCYMKDVKHVLQIRNLKTGSLLHHLPVDVGTVYEISGRRRDSEVFVGVASFLTPSIIYQCNLRTKAPELKIYQESVVPGYEPSEFKVDQVFFFLFIFSLLSLTEPVFLYDFFLSHFYFSELHFPNLTIREKQNTSMRYK